MKERREKIKSFGCRKEKLRKSVIDAGTGLGEMQTGQWKEEGRRVETTCGLKTVS